MSSEKKVLFLILLLIILIVACVFSHAPQLVKEEETNITNEPTKIEVVGENQAVYNDKVEENNQTVVEETINNNKTEELESPNINPVEENKEETPALEEENKISSNVQETQNSEIVQQVEEPKEPLLITGKKYIREGNERAIEELSFDTQKLQLEINEFVKEKPVNFKRAGYKTTKESDFTIKKIADILKENPNIKIEIAGHTDAVGEAKMNQEISLARAQTVEQKLISFGINKDRLVARGYGENIPIDKTSGYSKINRRVEFNIVEE